jgi:tetratricopeptide (TPR) repeat protein
MEHTGFPSEETLAAFIDGRLDDETRRRVVEHMANCTECYETFLGATEWGREGGVWESSATNLRTRRTWTVRIACVGAAAALVIIVGQPLHQWYESRFANGRIALVAVANRFPYRSIASRLTGGFEYRRLHVTRGMNDDEPDREGEITKIYAIAARNATDASSVRELHAFGAAELLLGRADAAADALEQAIMHETGRSRVVDAVISSHNTLLLTDLGAAYYQRFQLVGDPGDLLKSLQASQKALELGRTPEAAWNRALALEARRQTADAQRAWRDYLTLDKTSSWAREAVTHLHNLR